MIFVSLPKEGLKDSPAVIVDRLRSHWVNPGVHLILEGVILGKFNKEGKLPRDKGEEHFLIGFEGDYSASGDVIKTLEACHLGRPTIWEESNVYKTVEQAATFYLESGKPEVGAGIYQRFAEALPECYDALSNAGRFFLKLNRPELARPYLSQAYHLAPKVPEVVTNYFVLLQIEQKHQEAAALWEEISRKFPDHPIVRRMREEKARTETEKE